MSRDAVIAASDDEDSDVSFEALEDILAARQCPATPAKSRTPNAVFSTPQRKRGDSIFSSPLTIQPREPQFKMADLLNAAKRDSNIEASLSRFHEREKDTGAKKFEFKLAGESLRRTLEATVGDEHDHRLDKVVRAVERTEPISKRGGWFFFQPAEETRLSNRHKFPSRSVNAICGRQPAIKHEKDLDLNYLNKSMRLTKSPLPDELFLWLLDELCTERSGMRREGMCELVRLCSDDIAADKLTPRYLEGLFLRLGANQDIKSLSKKQRLKPIRSSDEGFYKRDWQCLCSVLNMVWIIAEKLSTESSVYLIQLLISMSVDPELLHDPWVMVSYRHLLHQLVAVLPREQWDNIVSPMLLLTLLVTILLSNRQSSARR